jgi:AcrR family transcriptional regulator
MDMPQERRRLTADDWAQAALSAVAEGGVTAVSVEPLAARLGATQGSFYWHFANRDALLTSAVELWERRNTDAVIAGVEADAEPARRLEVLFARVTGRGADERLEVNLLAASDHPLVGPAVRRVTARRLAYVVQLFTDLGFPAAQARYRGLLAFTAYVGQAELAVAVPDLLPRDHHEQQEHLRCMLAALTSDAPDGAA